MGQPHKKSKRARKERDKNSLRQKKRRTEAPVGNANDAFLESDELQAGMGDSSNALILTSKHTAEAAEATEPEAPPPPKLSNAARRKLAQVERAKAARAQRADVMSALSASALPADQAALLRGSASRGQRPTKRQRLRRELLAQRLGVALQDEHADGAGLEVERQLPAEVCGSDASDSDSDAPAAGTYVLARNGLQQQPRASAAVQPWQQDGDSQADDSDAEEDRGKPLPLPAPRQKPQMTVEEQRAAAEALRRELGLSDAAPTAAAAAMPQQPSIARVVRVTRPPDIAEARQGLPIVGMEQEIMEAVAAHDIVLLCGETGCGKTTQVPQFLYEAGYGCVAFPERSGAIGVTQPRRVAAVSTATRVAEELSSAVGDTVGYQVRYDRAVGAATAIKFMTDGILMREVQDDFLLRRYSVVVIDEAHERSLNTDLLLGLLSRVVPLRRKLADVGDGAPLKLLIMSATLRLEDFAGNSRLFPVPPPVLHVPARQFPVTLHFARRTELHDYVGAAFKKVRQIHRRLPPGGILVFVTGQREVEHLVRKLRSALSPAAVAASNMAVFAAPAEEADAEAELAGADAAERDAEAADNEDPTAYEEVSDAELLEDGDDEEETQLLGGGGFTPEQLAAAEAHFQADMGMSMAAAGSAEAAPPPVHVLPLYAMLPAAQQARVFAKPPEGHRLIVVATNVAETSLTIPGIRYVVDAGRSKQRLLEGGGGLARFEVRWISQAAAVQRAGRAGRTGPGHCYRLYSSAVFNDTFPVHGPPEIANTALEGVVLAMKSLAIDRVANFPFPSPPPPDALQAAAACLEALGALDARSGRLTERGRAMARLPISPRHARMLLQAAEEDVAAGSQKGASLPHAILLAAAMSVENPFLHSPGGSGGDTAGASGADAGPAGDAAGSKGSGKGGARKKTRKAHAKFRHASGDAMSALLALCAYMAVPPGAADAFCRDNRLASRSLREAAALAGQLRRIVAAQARQQEAAAAAALPAAAAAASALGAAAAQLGRQLPTAPPSPRVALRLRRALAAGWADQVCRRVTTAERLRSLVAAGKGGSRAVRYQPATSAPAEVFLHPRSALAAAAPDMVVYTELLQTEKRAYMSGATAIEASWMPEVAAPPCTLSAPLDEPPPQYSPAADAVLSWHNVSFSQHAWQLPRVQRPHPDATARCAAFAAALLAGHVLPAWQPLVPLLADRPASAAASHARHVPRVGELLAALTAKQVDSRASLAAAWRADPAFLKRQLRAWVRKDAAAAVDSAWHQLLAEAVQQ